MRRFIGDVSRWDFPSAKSNAAHPSCLTAIFNALLMPFLIITACSNALRPGSGSETTTGIVGTLIDDQGNPQQHARVILLPADYNPVIDNTIIHPDTTDSLGNFYFGHIAPGSYSIEAIQLDAKTRAAIRGIQAEPETVAVCAGILRKPGTIKVMLSDSTNDASAYVFIPGTTHGRFLRNRSDNFVVLDSVPAGTIPSVNYATTNALGSKVIKYDVVVPSGDSVTIMNLAWKYEQRLFLNTSPAGADVSGAVTDFPVLIRLNGGNFNFNEAKPDGGDLRFTKENNAPLQFEIARWDAANQSAEVWVKVDTVRGNDSTHHIVMYYGNPSAANVSKSSAVFDSGSGFAAVWHLDGSCLDASGNGRDGINYGATDTAGIIGQSKKFTGKDSIKIAGLLGTPENVTLSAWAQLDSTFPGSGGEIVSIGDATLLRMDYAVGALGTMGSTHLVQDSAFFNVSSGQFLKQTGWHYLAFSFNQSAFTATLYIDGAKIGSRTNQNVPIIYSGVGQNTFIGKHGNGKPTFNFIGRIDEVRVCSNARSSDWIKLCYMNQRIDDQLVKFK